MIPSQLQIQLQIQLHYLHRITSKAAPPHHTHHTHPTHTNQQTVKSAQQIQVMKSTSNSYPH